MKKDQERDGGEGAPERGTLVLTSQIAMDEEISNEYLVISTKEQVIRKRVM